MALIIKTNEGTFDVPNDFSVEVEITSPVYSEKGTQTISETLPGTRRNLDLVGHIHRMDIMNAPEKDVSAVIADGVYRRTGKLNVTSASKKGGIVCNIGFDESLMYDAWTDVSLKNLPTLPVYRHSGGLTELLSHLSAVMNYTSSADYYVFPIQVASEEVDNVVYPDYVNHIELVSGTYDLKKSVRVERLMENGTLTDITVPAGYGISPFLKVSRILELIFTAYGYQLTENPFATHYQLKKMVVLNNVKDTITEGYIDYKDLMPDCTINEFLDSLYCRTGAKIYVNSDTKKARVVLLKDTLNAVSSDDWTLLRTSELVPTFEQPKQLKLSAQTSFEGADSGAESFEEFLGKYNGIISSVEGLPRTALPTDRYILYQPSTGTFFRTNMVSKTHTRISSDFFPWDKKTPGIDYEEIAGNDECVPMLVVSGGFLYPQYLSGSVHNHTTINGSSTMDKDKTKTPLAFCFAMGAETVNVTNSTATYFFGSSFCRSYNSSRYIDADGNLYNYSLTFRGEDGAFNRFFKEYDAILRHANHSVEGEAILDKSILARIDTSKPIAIGGQRLMIESVSFTLPLKKSKPATIKLRTTKLLKPFDLAAEQSLESMQEQLYAWKLVEYSQIDCQRRLEEVIMERYGKTIPQMEETGVFISLHTITLLTSVSDSDFSAYLPPTHEDSLSKKEILNKYNAEFTWVAKVYSTSTSYTEKTTYRAGIQAYAL